MPGTYASHILYLKELKMMAGDHHIIRILFRDLYLIRFLKTYGHLWCAYCGKDNLKIYTKNNSAQLATIDHIIPIASGGRIYDLNNISVVCNSCNKKKASKSLSPFQAANLQQTHQQQQRLLRTRNRPAIKINDIRSDFIQQDLNKYIRRHTGLTNISNVFIQKIQQSCPF